MNWRRPILSSLLRAKGSQVPEVVRELFRSEFRPEEERRQRQEHKLNRLLLHAWNHTSWYRELFQQSGLMEDGVPQLSRFTQIPLLTKAVIRDQGERMKASGGMSGRKPYANSTGGSTGEPIRFVQDSVYDDFNSATKLYFMEMLGKEPGARELKIWGSERDLFEGTIGLKAKLQFFAYNRQFANCFHLSPARIEQIIRQNNVFRPRLIWGYVDGLYVIAQYANQKGHSLHQPAAIVSAAGTLFPHMREEIERAFGAPVYNYYGSREMGAMACECPKREGLHLFSETHLIETVDEKGTPVTDQEGELVVTSLENFAMPLIRYRIGDRGTLTSKTCSCGRSWPLLSALSGRIMESFVNAAGDIIPPEYFIHLVGVVYNSGFIRKFQVIQEDYSHVHIRIVLKEDATWDDAERNFSEIDQKIRLVMGQECQVTYEQVQEIASTASGKYLYTVSKVAKA